MESGGINTVYTRNVWCWRGCNIEGTQVEIFLINLSLGGVVYCCTDDGYGMGGNDWALNVRVWVTFIPREHVGGPWYRVEHIVVQGNAVYMEDSKCRDVGDEVISQNTTHYTLHATNYTIQRCTSH